MSFSGNVSADVRELFAEAQRRARGVVPREAEEGIVRRDVKPSKVVVRGRRRIVTEVGT